MTTNKEALDALQTLSGWACCSDALSGSKACELAKTIRTALQEQSYLVDKSKALYEALEKTNWSSWQTTASFSKQQQELGEAIANVKE